MNNLFHVVGIDENDGSATILHEASRSSEAYRWMTGYASTENAGNWKRLEVLDNRSLYNEDGEVDGEGCAETVFVWEAFDA
ncbi:MAG: hypothetical protein ABJA10_00130 [Aestuariivirga sp.]